MGSSVQLQNLRIRVGIAAADFKHALNQQAAIAKTAQSSNHNPLFPTQLFSFDKPLSPISSLSYPLEQFGRFVNCNSHRVKSL